MKKFLSVTLILILSFNFFIIPSYAYRYSENFQIEVISNNEMTCRIVGYIGKDSRLTIPQELSGYKVVEISNKAFLNNDKLKSVELPNTVIRIGECFLFM